ncbi:MAG TPA: nucleoside deaminase [Flavisolibacter sp.]|jgi:tRNA(adenine34) deaminase|nr:nucleoside deaminase [Flavisolibacter sp.]
MKDDTYYIKRCEILAEAAAAQGEAPVGSVIIKEGEIICEAIEASKDKNDVTCHAELEAIRLAVKKLGTNDLSDCVIYSTHEPCIMCSYAIRFYKIKKIVFLHTVKYFGGISSSMPLLLIKEVPPHWGGIPEVVHLENM